MGEAENSGKTQEERRAEALETLVQQLAEKQLEKPKRKTADRPHWITILIGLGSPLLAGVALIISLESLKTNQQSIKVGQRAYLTVNKGKVIIRKPDNEVPISDHTKTLIADYEIQVDNLGNTPAQKLAIDFRWLDARGNNVKYGIPVPNNLPLQMTNQGLVPLPDTVGPKGFVTLRGSSWLVDNKGFATPSTFMMYGSVFYEDVFHISHSVQWCWQIQTDKAIQSCCISFFLLGHWSITRV